MFRGVGTWNNKIMVGGHATPPPVNSRRFLSACQVSCLSVSLAEIYLSLVQNNININSVLMIVTGKNRIKRDG